jgi:hypothetical protein
MMIKRHLATIHSRSMRRFRPIHDCELFFQQMESMDPFGTSCDMDDGEFYEYDDKEKREYLETPFCMVPNVIAAMASVTRNIEAKLTHVEHKYGKTLEQLRPNFVWASTDRSRRC